LIQRTAVPLKSRDQLALPLKPPLAFAQMLLSLFKVSRSLVRVRQCARHVLKLPREGDCSRLSPMRGPGESYSDVILRLAEGVEQH
jgi:hypothetical protein